MPFSTAFSPSIQLGLLQAALKREEISVSSLYFNVKLAASLGWDLYEALCNDRTLLLGEWLFSYAAFGEDARASESYLDSFGPAISEHLRVIDRDESYLLDLRARVLPAFIDDCYNQVDWGQFDVVGFSSIFEQNCASLALARRLKAGGHKLVTVFGGANFEDEMGLEYVRAFPWIDYAVIGEGDEVFPAFLKRLAAGEDAAALPGVASRRADGGVRFAGRATPVTDLDALPEPDYGDYFVSADYRSMPESSARAVVLPFETARGCWWGAKHHCTFCGLNGLGMAFRSKTPDRALREIDALAERYGRYQLFAVDNIMDLGYIDGVFGKIADLRRDYTFFYETKANLTHTQLSQLARGGIRHLQPGIESLSTNILKLMRKGTTALQNVRILKWGRYYQINMHWNVLLGFPGESLDDYAQQLATMRLIPHLQPPVSVGRLWLERFSPNFSQHAELGISDIRPEPTYAHVYPDGLDLSRIAYFFEYTAAPVVPISEHKETVAYVDEWRAAWSSPHPPFLVYQRGAERLTVTDGRDPEHPRVTSFGRLGALVYECCAPVGRSLSRVVESVRTATGGDVDRETIQSELDTFVSLGLMLEEGGHYLSLALPINQNW
jgi:ribosomal peptide maturation radical SAM protein 1